MAFEYIIDRVKAFEEDIVSIVLKGSRLDVASLDYWSDTDVVYFIKDDRVISPEYVKDFLEGFGQLLAQESYSDDNFYMIRGLFMVDGRIEEWDILLTNYKNFIDDFTFPEQSRVIYGQSVDLKVEGESSPLGRSYKASEIEGVWYKLYGSVKRICRGDNLIGLHLLLDAYRDMLVVKMVDRDLKMNTTIHRFGGHESLKDLRPLSEIRTDNTLDLLTYIARLGKCYDQMMLERFPEYKSRYSGFQLYCEESKMALINQSSSSLITFPD